MRTGKYILTSIYFYSTKRVESLSLIGRGMHNIIQTKVEHMILRNLGGVESAEKNNKRKNKIHSH